MGRQQGSGELGDNWGTTTATSQLDVALFLLPLAAKELRSSPAIDGWQMGEQKGRESSVKHHNQRHYLTWHRACLNCHHKRADSGRGRGRGLSRRKYA